MSLSSSLQPGPQRHSSSSIIPPHQPAHTQVIENIEHLTNLIQLWLGKNKIRKLECLDTFANLQILSIQSNRITKMEGLEGLVNLEDLYLSHNGLKKIEGLEKNVSASGPAGEVASLRVMTGVKCQRLHR